jgi:hypothetical protein
MILYLTHHTQYICQSFVEEKLKLRKGYFEKQFESESHDREIDQSFAIHNGPLQDEKDEN